jgi:hypothetical protein
MGAVMILSMAKPASAKPGEIESGYVTSSLAITGPGLTGAVALDQGATQTYADLSNMFNPGSRMHVRPSSVGLGPRFDALLTLACVTPSGTYATVSIRQELYPYATFSGHPLVWTNTPKDQVACQGFVVAGWNAARRGLFQTLAEAGLPLTAPAPVQAPVSDPSRLPGPQPDQFWRVFGVASALLTLLLITVVLGRRQKARVLN